MIDIFSVLGHRLAAFGKTPDTVEVVRRAAVENPWFLPQEIIRVVKAIRCEMLERQRLEAWAGAYPPAIFRWSVFSICCACSRAGMRAGSNLRVKIPF